MFSALRVFIYLYALYKNKVLLLLVYIMTELQQTVVRECQESGDSSEARKETATRPVARRMVLKRMVKFETRPQYEKRQRTTHVTAAARAERQAKPTERTPLDQPATVTCDTDLAMPTTPPTSTTPPWISPSDRQWFEGLILRGCHVTLERMLEIENQFPTVLSTESVPDDKDVL
jgi:hypothetical protein